jgi:hypothetical protein
MSETFFNRLVGFDEFQQLTVPSHYAPVPEDWYVFITDVVDSTSAVEAGRYKEVNLVGAATIIALLNIAGESALPYVFGGDGSTILVPPRLLGEARDALSALQNKVRIAFGLELRACTVPMYDLYQEGATLSVAKYNVSAHVSQAVFKGTALAMAEHWVKQRHGTVLPCTPPVEDTEDANLSGLECRWQPVQNQHGKILSLLVKASPHYTGDAMELYSQLLADIAAIYPAQATPVSAQNLKVSLSPVKLRGEVRLRAKNVFSARMKYLLRIMGECVVGIFAFGGQKTVAGFDGKRYMAEVIANTDARKFDEMLRMVLDSTPEQHQMLASMLEQRRARGEILYGIHASPQALMTCLVFNRAGNHVHFVDGDDGGYALAAKHMKQQYAEQGKVAA